MQIASATGMTGQCKYPSSRIDFVSATMRQPTVMRGERLGWSISRHMVNFYCVPETGCINFALVHSFNMHERLMLCIVCTMWLIYTKSNKVIQLKIHFVICNDNTIPLKANKQCCIELWPSSMFKGSNWSPHTGDTAKEYKGNVKSTLLCLVQSKENQQHATLKNTSTFFSLMSSSCFHKTTPSIPKRHTFIYTEMLNSGKTASLPLDRWPC